MVNTPSIKIGTVSHYYDKIGVAVVDLVSTLTVGEKIGFSGSADFSQIVESIQVEHQSVSSSPKGSCVGLKVIQPVKPGDEINRLS